MLTVCRIMLLGLLNMQLCLVAFGQAPPSDSAILASSVINLQARYTASVRDNLHLYNGREYLRNSQLIKGSPYAIGDDLLRGTVNYDGVYYPQVMINFDISGNQVIIRDFTGSFPIVLVPEKIRDFSIGDHYFARLITGDTTESASGSGFCERLFISNSVQVYVKRTKSLYRPLNALTEDNMSLYKVYEKYFLLKDHSYKTFSNLKEMLALLGDDAARVRKFARSKNMKLNKIADEAVKTLLAYYTQIKS